MNLVIIAAVSVVVSVGIVGSLPVLTSKHYNNSRQLDEHGKYILHWNFNDTHIEFEVDVETNGYVGFGISPNGNMFPADVVIGWVKDGIPYLSDRHTTAHASPQVDKSQDWTLLGGEEIDSRTILRFVRKLEDCDAEDMNINKQTVRLIYSYHPDDPISETNLPYHGFERRGTMSVSLLSTSQPPAVYKHEDVKVLDLRNRNYVIPDKSTTYLCTAFMMPDLGGKHHITEFEVVYTPGNEHLVHHASIQRCNGTGYSHLDMAIGECEGPFPKGWPRCPELVAVWATGGGPYYFPEEAGYPVGGDDDLNFYVLQVHYNNPTHKSGVLDSSGIRLKLTSKLRQYDLTAINLGVSVNNHQVIPPHENEFISRGYCAPDCFSNAMNHRGVSEAKVIGAFQHAHLLARGITTRHFRNGVELEPLMDDPHYDFYVQDTRPVLPVRTIKPGDNFVVECNYDTMDRTQPSFGGFSTREEMCLTIIYVYPKIPLMSCSSSVDFNTYWSGNITSDKELHQQFLNMDWNNPQVKQDFSTKLQNSNVTHHCVNTVNDRATVDMFRYRENVKPFVRNDPYKNCTSTGTN